MAAICIVSLLVLVGCGVATRDDTSELAASEPAITSVTTDDGFTQLRQNATATLVITGRRLQHTTSVSVGGFFATLDLISARELRVTVFTGVSPLGPIDVTVTSRHDITVAPGALELTPFVVSPTATAGRGTFQSPMSLCDPELELSIGATVLLLPGTHRCGRIVAIGGAATVLGDPDEPTILTGTADGGFGISLISGDATTVTTFRDITFAPPLAPSSIEAFDGGLDLDRIVDAGGILASGEGFTTIRGYTYEGEGTALDLVSGSVTSSTVRHCGAGDGIRVAVGHPTPGGSGVTIHDVIVQDCARGLVVGPPAGFADTTGATVTSTQLIDNERSVSVLRANVLLTDSVVRDDESTPRPGLSGMSLGGGNLFLTRVQITGQDVGISVQRASSFGPDAQLFTDQLEIVGGISGIEFSGIDNNMVVRNTIVRDQTRASLLISALDAQLDLGTSSSPGNNALSVVSGFAIDDVRTNTDFLSRYIQAVGTTLNGVSFAGQTIDGPAELPPHYRIADFDSGIQF